MAYKKRTSSGARKRSTGYTGRSRSAVRGKSGAKRSAGRSVNTIRIVVEQPQAVSSVMPGSVQTARKAAF